MSVALKHTQDVSAASKPFIVQLDHEAAMWHAILVGVDHFGRAQDHAAGLGDDPNSIDDLDSLSSQGQTDASVVMNVRRYPRTGSMQCFGECESRQFES